MGLPPTERASLLEELDKHHPVAASVQQSQQKGKPLPSAGELMQASCLKAHKDQGMCASAHFDDVAIMVVRDGYLSQAEKSALSQASPTYAVMIPCVKYLTAQNFDHGLLRQPRLDYASQKEIPFDRVIRLTALAIDCGCNFGKVVRFLGGEFTGHNRDPAALERDCAEHVDKKDMQAMLRMLRRGCPAKLQFEMPRHQKLRQLRRGNGPSVLEHHEEVWATMNKEEKNSHLLPFLPFIVWFSNTAFHVPQGMVLKPGSDPRLVWDGSTKLLWDDVVMNDIVPLDDEAEITFGNVKTDYLKHIYNTRVSYPDDDIDLANADVKAAHRYPRIQPDLAGAFGFVITGLYYFIATAMVFGSIISATAWEPFRRAIEQMTAAYSLRWDLVEKHRNYLDMITIAPPSPPGTTFTAAVRCPLNQGVLDEDGSPKPIPNFIYVDDCLLACARKFTERLLCACVEAIFVVLGRPDTAVRQCPLAINKWTGMTIGHSIVSIGLTFDSRAMTVGLTREYLDKVLAILDADWPVGTTTFTLDALLRLAGRLARLGEGAPWVYHLMPQIYASIAHALRSHESFLLAESPTFINLIKRIKALRRELRVEDDVKQINFYIKNAARRKFRSKFTYPINKTLAEELALLRSWLAPDSGVTWTCPIGHLIPRTPFAIAAGDACCYGGGGFSTELRFWWHLRWPKSIYRRTKVFITNNKNGRLVSINVLEFVAIIVNYVAALTVLRTTDVTQDPHPVLLNLADSMSAIRWATHHCKDSLAGRALGRMFCMLLVDSPLGINAEHIKGEDNVIADEISRLRLLDDADHFDYSLLKQKFQQLRDCRAFQPSPELLSLLWQCVLQQKSPTPSEIHTLKQNGLGKLSS